MRFHIIIGKRIFLYAFSLHKEKNDKIKDTGWKTATNLFKKMGITPLANFFEKKNEQAKLVALAKSVSKDAGLKKHIAGDTKIYSAQYAAF